MKSKPKPKAEHLYECCNLQKSSQISSKDVKS